MTGPQQPPKGSSRDAGPGQPGGIQFRPPNRSAQIEQRQQQKRQDALQDVANQVGGHVLRGREPVAFADGIPVIEEPPQFVPEQLQEEEIVVEPPKPKKAAPVKKAPNYEHPVVSKLLKTFGVKQEKYYEVEVFAKGEQTGTKYTMSQVPDEITLWAISDAQTQIALKGETASVSWYQCLITSSAVVAIDDEPIYGIFGIKLNKDEEIAIAADRLDLSIRLKQLCGRSLAELLWKKTRGVVEKLNDFYSGAVVGSNQVSSTYDQDIDKKDRFVCPMDACTMVYVDKALPDGQDYFCKIHGIPMVMAANLKEELDIPLP